MAIAFEKTSTHAMIVQVVSQPSFWKAIKKRIILYFKNYSKLKWVHLIEIENYGKGIKYLRNSRTFILEYH